MRIHTIIIIFTVFLGFIPRAGAQQNAWLSVNRGDFLLYCQEADKHLADDLLISAGKKKKELLEFIPVAPKFAIHLILAPDEKSYEKLTGGAMPAWSSGAANPSAGIIFLKSPRIVNPAISIHRIMHHELSHIMLGAAAGDEPVERWFDEGLAVYVSSPKTTGDVLKLAGSAGSGRLHSLEELSGMLGFSKAEAGLAYLEARSAIEYLIQEYSPSGLKAVIGRIAAGYSMEKAFKETIGISLEDFETGWKQDLRKRYRWAIFMDAGTLMMTLFVLLFFAALAATMLRVRRKKLEWENELE